MVARRLKIVVPEDHRISIEVPAEVPAGPAEVIFLVPRSGGELEERIVPEEAKERFQAMAAELASDERAFKDLNPLEKRQRLHRVMGIGRGLFSPSDELARRKQEDIDLEDRPLGR